MFLCKPFKIITIMLYFSLTFLLMICLFFVNILIFRVLLIKLTKQVNYKAEGLILSLVNGGQDKAVIIKFKDQTNNSHARVNQYQGVYIFVDNDPLTPYDYAGNIIPKNKSNSNQYTSIRELFLQKCVKDFGQAKGMILKFVNGGADIGDAIKFKN